MRSVRNINDPAERPEVGTSEAAVSTCVSLIAGMCEQPEAVVEYWLDLYYFVRAANERETIGQCPDIIRKEDLLPELRKLWMEVLSVPLEEQRATTSSAAEAAPSPSLEKAKGKAPAGGTVKDQKQARPGNQNAAVAAEFKKKTVERLDAARAAGVTASDISKVCNGAISRDQILMIAAREKMPVAVYKVLAAGLDAIEEKQGGKSREHEGTDTGAAGTGPAA